MASRPGGTLVSWCVTEADHMLDKLKKISDNMNTNNGHTGHHRMQTGLRNMYHLFPRIMMYTAKITFTTGMLSLDVSLLRQVFLSHPRYENYHYPSYCMDRNAE